MTPAQPPFPTDWSLRFQFEVGSQNSTLISESLEGLSVAATRQNSGRSLYTLAPFPLPGLPGGTNAPGATICAAVMFVSGNARDARLSQDAANAGAEMAHARTSMGFCMVTSRLGFSIHP